MPLASILGALEICSLTSGSNLESFPFVGLTPVAIKIFEHVSDSRAFAIAFLSIPPASPSKGIDFLKCSPKEALRYQNEAAFTIFGSPVERSEWTCLLNNAFKSIANEKGWIFIDNSKAYELVTDQKNYFIDKKYTFDQTHINEPEMYTQTIIQCIKRMHNSYIQ